MTPRRFIKRWKYTIGLTLVLAVLIPVAVWWRYHLITAVLR